MAAVSNFSAALPLIQANRISYLTPSSIGIFQSSHRVINVSTTLPAPFYPNQYSHDYTDKVKANYRDIKSGFCAIGDDFCSFKNSNGTISEAITTNFTDQCLLWDASCSGNRTLAIEKFFDIAFSDQTNDSDVKGNLLDNDCFIGTAYDSGVNESDWDTYNSPERLSDFNRIKTWMRSSQCVTAANEWINMTGYPWGYVFDAGMNVSQAGDSSWWTDNSSAATPSCCGVCDISAQNVDLYYWPDPDANLSCLSIIGESVKPHSLHSRRPMSYGEAKGTI